MLAYIFSILTAVSTPDSTQKWVVNKIDFTGLKRTREYVVRRELALQKGDSLSMAGIKKQLELDRQKVWNTNLFLTVEPKIDVDSVRKSLTIHFLVKERFYILAIPMVALADRNFNEWWYDRGRDLSRIIYGIYGTYENVTGRSDRLRIRAEFGFIPRLDIYYSTPYIDKAKKTGITIGFSKITNRSIAYRTNADKLVFLASETRTRERFAPYVSLSHRPKFYGIHFLTLAYSTTKLADTVSKLNENYFQNNRTRQNYFSIGYAYEYNNRDNAQYPLSGKVWGVQLSKAGLLPSDNVNIWGTLLYYAHFRPISKKWFFSYNTEFKFSAPFNQPFLQTRGLGYENDLVRGYELYVIDGQHYGYVHTNLRYELLDRVFKLKFLNKLKQFNALPLAIYPNIYLDAGGASNKYTALNNSRLANRLLVGGGIGLDFVTWYNFVARFNYSTNHLGEWRPYFAIGREF